jgi:phospholipase C
MRHTYIKDFAYSQTILSTYPQNVLPISQFLADAKSGNLPQVAQIEPASDAGLDEHPIDNDPAPGQAPCCSNQQGAAYVKSLIDAVMSGPSWQDTVFILTFDEPGGFFDHVAPITAVSPDGVAPKDLHAGDVCTMGTGPTCDFVFTGYRVPLVVISPFSKRNYVSHTQADETAILKFIETRFGLQPLTARDKAQQTDMTEFFDFTTAPWKTPPSNLPSQNTSGQCFVNPPPTSP